MEPSVQFECPCHPSSSPCPVGHSASNARNAFAYCSIASFSISFTFTFGQITVRGPMCVFQAYGTRHSSDFVLSQILAPRFAGHPRFHCTHPDGPTLIALDDELGELGSGDQNPEQQPPPRSVSNSMAPLKICPPMDNSHRRI